jgi:hypothetical protein
MGPEQRAQHPKMLGLSGNTTIGPPAPHPPAMTSKNVRLDQQLSVARLPESFPRKCASRSQTGSQQKYSRWLRIWSGAPRRRLRSLWRFEESEFVASVRRCHAKTEVFPIIVLKYLRKRENRSRPTLVRKAQKMLFEIVQFHYSLVGTKTIGPGRRNGYGEEKHDT